MASLRLLPRTLVRRTLTTSAVLRAESVPLNSRHNDTAQKHRDFMMKKPLNPHLTNTTSTIANDFPSLGADKPPADQLTSVAPDYVPTDSVPENTERMTGGTQTGSSRTGPNAELDVGEIEGGKFKVEPLKREGEEAETTRARLLYQSRKRGTLESDLLLSTFADAHLPTMSLSQMRVYDTFLDENDWDIYYWATQTPPPPNHETSEAAGGADFSSPPVKGTDGTDKKRSVDSQEMARAAESGRVAEEATAKAAKPSGIEWANTVGTFKPAYKPVPARWKNSEILAMLRKHVMDRSAGGVHEGEVKVEGEGLAQGVKSSGGGGLGFMPQLRSYREGQSSS